MLIAKTWLVHNKIFLVITGTSVQFNLLLIKQDGKQNVQNN